MELTGELKGKVEAADTIEEKKAIIEEAGMVLTDDELEGVSGGTYYMVEGRYADKVCVKMV